MAPAPEFLEVTRLREEPILDLRAELNCAVREKLSDSMVLHDFLSRLSRRIRSSMQPTQSVFRLPISDFSFTCWRSWTSCGFIFICWRFKWALKVDSDVISCS